MFQTKITRETANLPEAKHFWRHASLNQIFLYNTQQSNVSPAPQSTNNRPLQNFFILQYQQCLIGLCSFGPVSSKQGSNTKKLFQTRMKACLTRLAHFNLGFAVFWPILSFFVFGVVFLQFYLFSQTRIETWEDLEAQTTALFRLKPPQAAVSSIIKT